MNKITGKIIDCEYKISNKSGIGFLEKINENALCYELKKSKLDIKQQYNLKIKYENIIIYEYCTDILVEDKIILELKVVDKTDNVHAAQCINYLKSCLLINFGITRVKVKRIVNDF